MNLEYAATEVGGEEVAAAVLALVEDTGSNKRPKRGIPTKFGRARPAHLCESTPTLGPYPPPCKVFHASWRACPQ